MLTAVLAGRTYTGEATVADRPYVTAYEGLHSPGASWSGCCTSGCRWTRCPAEPAQTWNWTRAISSHTGSNISRRMRLCSASASYTR